MTAFLPITSPLSLAEYIFFYFFEYRKLLIQQISKTPIIEITKYIMVDFMKIFTIDAIIIPIKPIIKNEPNLVKSFLVV